MLSTVKTLYVFFNLIYPKLFPISSFYRKRNRSSKKVNANVGLLLSYYRWWFKLGPKDCTTAVPQRQWPARRWYWPQWSWNSYIDEMVWDEARNKGVSQRQWEALEAMDELWYIQKVKSESRWHVSHSFLLLLLKLLTPLAKLYTLAPQVMGLLSSDNTAAWIQCFP